MTLTIELDVYTDNPVEAAALRAYWLRTDDGEAWAHTVTEVRRAYGLSHQQMTRIVRTWGTAYLPEIRCTQCGNPQQVANRTHYADATRRANLLCGACQADAEAEQERAAQERAERRRAQLVDRFPVWTGDKPAAQSMSLFSAVALHALFSDPAVEAAGLTTPVDAWPKERRWAPDKLRHDFERRLMRAMPTAIRPHPDSRVDAFEWENDSPTGSIYLGKVSYYLVGPETDLSARPAPLLPELNRIFREGPWPEQWLDQWRDVWEELALAHASAYLDMRLREHRMEMKQGDGTLAVFADALATFSLGQVFNFIYRATKDSAAYYQRGGVPKFQAANSTVGRISASAARARASGWETKAFGLPWNLPWSAIAETFFTNVMWQPDMLQVTLRDVSPPAHAWGS